jgi:signal transduction histidine kinase
VPHTATVRRLLRWVPRMGWPWPPGVIDTIWAVFALANLDMIFMFPGWETIPFHAIWASLTLVYGFRTWRVGPTLWIMSGVMVLTAAGIAVDVWVGQEPVAELTEDPLLALMFLAMAWHARRKLAIERSHRLVSEHNTRLLTDQRRFLQDAAHQLRTPITIALGHAELLADDVTGQQSQDIQVVIGELNGLRRISERLLLIASAADPEFLHPELVALDRLTMELIRRWRPTVDRRWQLGRLDPVTVRADRERLGLALDALLENAVRHTGADDVIQLSVIRGWPGMPVRIVVADSGSGIPQDRLHLIFDRFRTGDDKSRGTGLGLPLVRAVARAHGGDVTVNSGPGAGSEFELTLPELASVRPELPTGSGATGHAGSGHTGSGAYTAADAKSAAADHEQQQRGSARR